MLLTNNSILSYLLLGQFMNFNFLFYVGAIFMIIHLFFYQLKKFDSKNINVCLSIFKSNNLFGFIVLIFIILGKLNI